MQAINQFTMGSYMLQILNLGELVNGLFFQWFCLEHLNLPYPFPENSLRFCSFPKIPWGVWLIPEISLIYHGKTISLSFLECVGTLANSGDRCSIYISDIRGIVAPSPTIFAVTMRSSWPIQEDANGRFVSNKTYLPSYLSTTTFTIK